MRKLIYMPLLGLFLCYIKQVKAQDIPPSTDRIANFPSSFISRIDKKIAYIDKQLTRQSEKYLQRLAKQEKKLKRRLSKIDSSAAQKLFANSEQQYPQMIERISSGSQNTAGEIKGRSTGGQYLPYIDSMKTGFSFLTQNSSLLSNSNDVKKNYKGHLGR